MTKSLRQLAQRTKVKVGDKTYQRHGDGWIPLDDEGAAMGMLPLSHDDMAALHRG